MYSPAINTEWSVTDIKGEEILSTEFWAEKYLLMTASKKKNQEKMSTFYVTAIYWNSLKVAEGGL